MINLQKYSPAYQEAVEILYAPPFKQQILTAGILYPIIEELIFRGALFGLLRKKLSFVWAMTISAVVFGIYHGNLVQFVYAGLIGFLFAFYCEKYKTLVAPIVSHITMNTVIIVLTEIIGRL